MDKFLKEAESWIGTPFHPQAQQKNYGCDCFGFLLGVYGAVTGNICGMPPYSLERAALKENEQMFISVLGRIANVSGHFEEGHIILFKAYATLLHCGVMSERSQYFLHAQEQTGVVKTRFSEKWQRRVARIYKFKE